MDRQTQEFEYKRAVGERALARQKDLSETRFACCWEHIEHGHNVACRYYVAPVVLDEQPSLV